MIKRLKWNTLYGGGRGDESDGSMSSGSEDSNESDPATRTRKENVLLRTLAEEDPDIAQMVRLNQEAAGLRSKDLKQLSGGTGKKNKPQSFSGKTSDSDADPDENIESDEEDGQSDCNSDTRGSGGDKQDSDQEYVEWRECDICPGKRFLHDNEVSQHLTSAKHLRAVVRHEKAQRLDIVETDSVAMVAEKAKVVAETAEDATSTPQKQKDKAHSVKEHVISESESQPSSLAHAPKELKGKKRKMKAKRKLKALKQRKWEQKMLAEKLENETGVKSPALGEAEADAAAPSGRGRKKHALDEESSPRIEKVKKRKKGSEKKGELQNGGKLADENGSCSEKASCQGSIIDESLKSKKRKKKSKRTDSSVAGKAGTDIGTKMMQTSNHDGDPSSEGRHTSGLSKPKKKKKRSIAANTNLVKNESAFPITNPIKNESVISKPELQLNTENEGSKKAKHKKKNKKQKTEDLLL